MYLENHFSNPIAMLILAHGAGAPMDSPFMEAMAHGLTEYKISVVRFEFPYMREIRNTGKKRPPDRAAVLKDCWRQVVAEHQTGVPLFIGGKSMGGRMATMVAAEGLPVAGTIALGYPFHPPGKPDRLRLEHLKGMARPTLIVQGERDPFGKRQEVESYGLTGSVEIHWIREGNHDFEPTRRSGLTQEDNLRDAIAAVAAFINRNLPASARD